MTDVEALLKRIYFNNNLMSNEDRLEQTLEEFTVTIIEAVKEDPFKVIEELVEYIEAE